MRRRGLSEMPVACRGRGHTCAAEGFVTDHGDHGEVMALSQTEAGGRLTTDDLPTVSRP